MDVKVDPRVAIKKLALNVANDVRESLLKNRIDQDKQDVKTLDKIDKNNKELQTAEVNKAKNNPDVALNIQSTKTLSDPQLDALKRRLIFDDKSKA
jgi:hypothetical protein